MVTSNSWMPSRAVPATLSSSFMPNQARKCLTRFSIMWLVKQAMIYIPSDGDREEKLIRVATLNKLGYIPSDCQIHEAFYNLLSIRVVVWKKVQ